MYFRTNNYKSSTAVTAGNFTVGHTYEIATVGTTTTWTSLGASAATIGTIFTASVAGSGNGTAYDTRKGDAAHRMVIDNSGNVGIGTTSPTYKLHISGETIQWPNSLFISPSTHATSRRASMALDNWYLMQDSGGNGTKDFGLYEGSTGLFRLFVNTSGNVGIGTSDPMQKLDIAGTLRLNGTTVGTNYTQIQSAPTPSSNVTYTFPASAPSAGQYLQSDASGNLTWATISTASLAPNYARSFLLMGT